MPNNKSTGRIRGFAFAHFKTECDTRRAIKMLNGRNIGGKQISVQMAKYDNRNSNIPNNIRGRGRKEKVLGVMNLRRRVLA